MFSIKHIIAGITVGLTLMLLGIVLIPERYLIQAQVRSSDEAPAAAVPPAFLSERTRAEEIPTVFGDLFLGYADGQVRLAGLLQSAEPCGDWGVDVVSSAGEPSMIEFTLDPQAFDDLCIQALGGESAVTADARARSDTLYLIRIGNEVVFSGQLPVVEDMSLENI